MRYTFEPDDCMVITIPLNNIRNAEEGQLMPNKFTCRFKDNYKVFQHRQPKALGMAQIVTAVFILCLGGILFTNYFLPCTVFSYILSLPSILYLVSGSLVIAAANSPLMPMMKASFVFNVMGLSIAPIIAPIYMNTYMCGMLFDSSQVPMLVGIKVVMAVLYMFEFLLSLILISWESKAICRTHFNSLPVITLKQEM